MDKGPLVDIIILNLNQERDTLECLASLKAMKYKDYRIILVDNGSTDGSGGRIKEKFPEIDLLRNDENLGFSGGCNTGIRDSLKKGRAGYVLLLNNDTAADGRLLTALLEVAGENDKIGIVGAINYYYSDPERVDMAAHRIIWWLGIHSAIYAVKDKYRKAQSVSACCMLIKRAVIEKVGMFDERFFAYYEDSDLCLRARRAGFTVAAARDARVRHKISAVLGTGTPEEYYIYSRNQPLFMLKNCPKIFMLNYFTVYLLKVFVRTVYFFAAGKRAYSRAVFGGFTDFIRGNFGKGRLFCER